MTDKSKMWKLIYNIHMFMTYKNKKEILLFKLGIYFYKWKWK